MQVKCLESCGSNLYIGTEERFVTYDFQLILKCYNLLNRSLRVTLYHMPIVTFFEIAWF